MSSPFPGGGYATEKLPNALRAAAVPVYWVDPLDADVVNARSVLVYGEDNATVAAAMVRLETDSAARAEWVSRPKLVPGVERWLDN